MEAKTEWLTIDEYAALMKLNPMTVRNWCKAGKIKAIKTESKWRIPYTEPVDVIAKAEVEALVDSVTSDLKEIIRERISLLEAIVAGLDARDAERAN